MSGTFNLKELRTLDERTLEEAVKSTSRHTWWDPWKRRWVSGGPRPWLVLCRSQQPSRPGTTQQVGERAAKLHPGVAPNGLGDPRAQSLNIARAGLVSALGCSWGSVTLGSRRVRAETGVHGCPRPSPGWTLALPSLTQERGCCWGRHLGCCSNMLLWAAYLWPGWGWGACVDDT